MRRRHGSSWAAFGVAAVVAGTAPGAPLAAQGAGSAAAPAPPAEVAPVAARARALVDAGNGASARQLLDSLVRATGDRPELLAEALYWRAVLGETAREAERDWKRLMIEAPLSPRVPEALLRLAELELLRGAPATARQHLDRLWRDHPAAAERPRSLLWLARAWFDERQVARACGALDALRGDPTVPVGELRLQADDLARRCQGVTAVAFEPRLIGAPSSAGTAPATASGAVAPAAKAASPSTPPAAAAPASAAGPFSVQLAAFGRRADADAMVASLGRRGIAARVDGRVAPYRVRVGRYATRAEAAEALARFEAMGMKGFVAELTP
jgi:cell division septation protein DedD